MTYHFDPARFGLVANMNGNLLLRGSEPLEGGVFAYDAMRTALESYGYDLDKFLLIDVCLIDNISEREMFEPEVSAMGIDPTTYPASFWPPWTQPGWVYGAQIGSGTLTIAGLMRPANIIWWPIEAPCGQPPAPFLGAPGWNLDGLVELLSGTLRSSTPVALYVHCSLGADRTGAAIASYLIETKGLTADEAISAVTAGTASRVAPSPAYQELIRAFESSTVLMDTPTPR